MPRLYDKYIILHADDGTFVEGFCFVLKPESDPAARTALRAYALATPDVELENDLLVWLQRFEDEHPQGL